MSLIRKVKSTLRLFRVLSELSAFQKGTMSVQNNARKKTYLFVLLPGDYNTLVANSFFMKFLQEQGNNIHALICDGLPACELTKIQNTKPSDLIDQNKRSLFCKDCSKHIAPLLSNYVGCKIHKLSDCSMNSNAINDFCHDEFLSDDSFKVSYLAGSVRYNAHIPNWDDCFVDNADVFKTAAREFISKFEALLVSVKPDVVISHHGIYVPMGLVPLMCRKYKIRYTCWNFAYRTKTVLFSHSDSYHKTIPKLSIKAVINELDVGLEDAVEIVSKFFSEKLNGGTDWIAYYDKTDPKLLNKNTDYSAYENVHLILPNIAWDAFINQFNTELPFGDQIEWILHFIKLAHHRPKDKFIIRVHPAETKHPIRTRVSLIDLVKKQNIFLPDNVEFISPDDPISSHDLIHVADCCHVFASKVGLEAALMGKLVTVSGDAWIRNKQIGIDIKRRTELEELVLRQKNFKQTQQQKDNAFLFAYYLFEKRCVEISALNPKLFSNQRLMKQKLFEPSKLPLDAKCAEQLRQILEFGENF